jgi:hypothetical protein
MVSLRSTGGGYRKPMLFAVLAIVCAVSLTWTDPPEEPVSAAVGNTPAQPTSRRRQGPDHALAASIPLEELLLCDPFVPPGRRSRTTSAAADDAGPVQPRARWRDDAMELSVGCVFFSDRGPAAMVNSRVVRPGDVIDDQYRVVEIRPTGIVVSSVDGAH